MSLREKFGFGARQEVVPVYNTVDIEKREAAHTELFTELACLRDVCKFILNGHPNHAIYVGGMPKYNITCIEGRTTRIKVMTDKGVDDYSISDVIISRATTVRAEANNKPVITNFDATVGYRHGHSIDCLAEQREALYQLQEELLVADGHIIISEPEADEIAA